MIYHRDRITAGHANAAVAPPQAAPADAKPASKESSPFSGLAFRTRNSVFAKYFDRAAGGCLSDGSYRLIEGVLGKGIREVRKRTFRNANATDYAYQLAFFGEPGMVIYGERFGFGSGALISKNGELRMIYCDGKVKINGVRPGCQKDIDKLQNEKNVVFTGKLAINGLLLLEGKIKAKGAGRPASE